MNDSLVIIFTNADGSVGIVHPIPQPQWNLRGNTEAQNDQEHLEQVATRAVPPGLKWRVIPRKNLPNRYEYRDAWRDNGSELYVDLSAARSIKMQRIREKRNRLLSALDLHKVRLDDVGPESKIKELACYRQALRNLPPFIEKQLINANTLEELDQIPIDWPLSPG